MIFAVIVIALLGFIILFTRDQKKSNAVYGPITLYQAQGGGVCQDPDWDYFYRQTQKTPPETANQIKVYWDSEKKPLNKHENMRSWYMRHGANSPEWLKPCR